MKGTVAMDITLLKQRHLAAAAAAVVAHATLGCAAGPQMCERGPNTPNGDRPCERMRC